jgi:crotonobetainyl-CoA:carnitine CoA-transferase CaiB-like acyl-CoA transferase
MSFLPLAGKRVVDVTSSLAGPTCTQLLAALGADVVKVEPPGGDHARAWGPPFVDGEGAMFLASNAGKRSVALDLSTPEGLERVLGLVDDADVFVQSLRPGAADQHGIGADALRARRPDLVYCSIGAFGSTGPLRDQPGYDPLLQAASGIMSVTGVDEMPPVRVGVSLIDLSTGLWAAFAIVSALSRGGGATIEVSLYETALWLLSYQIVGYLATGEVPGREGSAFAQIAPYQVFPTSDGELMIVAGNDKLFRGLCTVLGLPDDERFRTNPDRVTHRAKLAALIEERTRQWSTVELLDALVAAGIPASPVRNVGEAAEHPQTLALGMLQQLAGFTTVAQPFSVDGARVLQASPPPRLDGQGPAR